MSDKRYVIGVDGGNSKTDYFLFDRAGGFVDRIRAGTCSHEQFADGYASAYRIMNEHILALLSRNRLTLDDVAAGAFGLAGADVPTQKENLSRVIERIGLADYAVDNDSFLGIKAGSDKGYGVCSINGTGSSTGGISPSGRRLQIGGVGSELTGDEAGGAYFTRKIVRCVYDSFYRMGPETAMAAPVMALLGVSDPARFIETVLEAMMSRSLPQTELMRILFAAADDGDPAAAAIIDHVAMQLALSTAGCITNLDFDSEVDVVLAGSVWVRAESPLLLRRYQAHLAALIPHRCRFILLQVPPAAGAVLWALELAEGRPVDAETRQRVIQAIEGLKH